MPGAPFSCRTYHPGDLRLPQMAPWVKALRRFALRLGLEGTPFAVNGILRRRVWVLRHKLWEYVASVACLAPGAPESAGRPLHILDFGGAATLPIYFLASRGCQVECLDIDPVLCEATRQAAARHSWPLRASTLNLVETPPPADWQPFDGIISASVLEHVPKAQQPMVVARLASLLRPGGTLVLTFDYGADAPQPGAVRSVEEVGALVVASRLDCAGGQSFRDSGERFALDRRYPSKKFTFGALFLVRS
jgi:SAM-dependent methyltransferase